MIFPLHTENKTSRHITYTKIFCGEEKLIGWSVVTNEVINELSVCNEDKYFITQTSVCLIKNLKLKTTGQSRLTSTKKKKKV